jgi:hypothetical protein
MMRYCTNCYDGGSGKLVPVTRTSSTGATSYKCRGCGIVSGTTLTLSEEEGFVVWNESKQPADRWVGAALEQVVQERHRTSENQNTY